MSRSRRRTKGLKPSNPARRAYEINRSIAHAMPGAIVHRRLPRTYRRANRFVRDVLDPTRPARRYLRNRLIYGSPARAVVAADTRRQRDFQVIEDNRICQSRPDSRKAGKKSPGTGRSKRFVPWCDRRR